MLTVYRVGAHVDKYQFFRTDNDKFLDKIHPFIHGKPLEGLWKSPKVYIYNPLASEGDFLGFSGMVTFAVSPEARLCIRTFLDQSCEQLPLKYKGRTFIVLNCTNCIEALDDKKSGEVVGRMVEQYVFRPRRFNWSLFTIPQTRELFTVEGMAAPEDEFKGTVEKYGLKGLLFQEVWSDKPKRKRKKTKR